MILAIAAADTAMCGRCASGATCCMTAPSTGVGSGSRWDAGGRWVTCFLAPTPPWPVKSPPSERDHDLDEPLAIVADQRACYRRNESRPGAGQAPWPTRAWAARFREDGLGPWLERLDRLAGDLLAADRGALDPGQVLERHRWTAPAGPRGQLPLRRARRGGERWARLARHDRSRVLAAAGYPASAPPATGPPTLCGAPQIGD